MTTSRSFGSLPPPSRRDRLLHARGRTALVLAGRAARVVRAREIDLLHYRLLAGQIGANPPRASDLDISFPAAAFRRRTGVLGLGQIVEQTLRGIYLYGASVHTTPELRTQAASLAASEAAHLTVLERLNGGSGLGAVLPQAIDPERASAALGPCLGQVVSERALPAGEAARQLGISLDTLRRWDRAGRIQTTRDGANRRLVPEAEVTRIRGQRNDGLSARNRFTGVVREIRLEGLLAQVELDVAGPTRVTAVITRDAAEALGLEVGSSATAIVKATSVMVEG